MALTKGSRMKIQILLILVLGIYLQAGTIYVNAQNKAKNTDGKTWKRAYVDLNKALLKATKGDDIWLAKGEYRLKSIRIEGINIYGGFAANETELSQRDIMNNETKIYGRLALQNALVSSVTLLKEPEANKKVIELSFDGKRASERFTPNKKRIKEQRIKRQRQEDLDNIHYKEQVFEEEQSSSNVLTPKKQRKLEEIPTLKEERKVPEKRDRRRQGPPAPDEMFNIFDKNKDGRISKREAPPPMLRDWFRLDRNSDGFIDKKEMRPPRHDRERR